MKAPAFLTPYINTWQGLAPRERQLATAIAVVLGVFLLYLVLWAPMQRDLNRLRVSVPQDRAKLATMRAQANQVQQLRARLPAAGQRGNIMSVLEQTANTRGMRQNIARMEPDGPSGARVFMDEVSFNAMLAWLAELQSQGIRVENATVQRRPSPGLVNVRVLLRAPAA